MASSPLIAFYGDDFTGSTDALEVLAATGLKSILFVDVPTPETLARFEGLEAVGIAGNSRSLTPEEMREVIPPVSLHSSRPRHRSCITKSARPLTHHRRSALSVA